MSVTRSYYSERSKYTKRSMESVYDTIWSAHPQCECAAWMVHLWTKCFCNWGRM